MIYQMIRFFELRCLRKSQAGDSKCQPLSSFPSLVDFRRCVVAPVGARASGCHVGVPRQACGCGRVGATSGVWVRARGFFSEPQTRFAMEGFINCFVLVSPLVILLLFSLLGANCGRVSGLIFILHASGRWHVFVFFFAIL